MPALRCIGTWCKKLVWLFPPMVVLVAMLVTYQVNGLYPFTSKTISWCDMEQQVIPLLLQFKDVLAGKEGFFFSFKNAGGMNFYGVFFFFLASPFTFLVAFVEKADMTSFCNVLVMLKMCTCALTASLYFGHKNPNAPLLNIALSVLYAYSGYTMLYYQNVMWLDVAYLFPLLLWGLECLQQGKRALFVATLSASMTVNYYLGYMVVVFLLLYALVWSLISKDKKFAVNFILSCGLAALITAMVWLPCFWQYLSSGRQTSILTGLKNSAVLTHYETALPTIFSVLFLFPFALTQKETKDEKLRLILLLATLVPILFEPINKMWQTGSYMSFPTRYAFITVFLCLSLAFDGMSSIRNAKKTEGKFLTKIKNETPRYALSLLFVGVSIWYYGFARAYTDKNVEIMDQYSHSLWGNAQSFETLLGLYAIALLVGSIAFALWRFRLFKPVFLWLSVGVMVLSELYVSPAVYMIPPSHEVDWYQQVVELADKIEDDGFYRVKTDKEYSGRDFDVNLMGGLGYNALGHYTSLTGQGYMDTIKKWGYTGYWMEIGNSGGTLVTDALLSVKYQISSLDSAKDVYQGSYFNIAQTNGYLPLGIVAQKDMIPLESERVSLTRGGMQKTLYEDFFGSDGVTMYELTDGKTENLTVERQGEKYLLTPTSSPARITFTLPVEALSTVYFSAFDESSNALKQAINEKFSVRADGYYLGSYPTQKNNGILKIGEYADRTVSLEVRVLEQTLVKEMSVVAFENEKLAAKIAQTETLNLTVNEGKIGGRYETNEKKTVFLSLPYDGGLTLKINGRQAQLHKVYGSFCAFYLEAGVNDVEVTFSPKGFTLGATISAVGGLLTLAGVALWLLKKRNLDVPDGVWDQVAYYGVLSAGVLVVFIIYVAPMVLCAL